MMINLESNEGRVGRTVLNFVLILLKSLLNSRGRSSGDRRKRFLYRSKSKVNADSFLMHRE